LNWRLLLLALIFITVVAAGPAEVDQDWASAIEQSRAVRDEGLRSPDGWLTLAGLYWLEPGANAFGSDDDNPVVFDAPGVPANAGTLVLEAETVTIHVAPAARVELDGEAVTERTLRDDTVEGGPDRLTIGRLRFYVIRRADRFGVRVKDPQHPNLTGFEGLEFFPLDPGYRIDARFAPYDEPHEVQVLSVVGTKQTFLVPGVVEFTLHGKELSMLPFVSDPDDTDFWFIFKDLTSGKESYGFRYLSAEMTDGRVDLDFNRTYNPPCAFTPYATCPLPPKANRLDVRIESGERIYGKH
jgi:uncharacterized protein (DUF1684 family)